MLTRWHDLIDYWITQEFRHSLTFPFIIGALRTPVGAIICNKNFVIDELAELVNLICDYNNDNYFFHIYRCPDLDKHVLARIDGKQPPKSAIKIVKNGSEASNLYVSDFNFDEKLISPGTIINELWLNYGESIISGKFSCRGKCFQEFSSADLDFIKRALA